MKFIKAEKINGIVMVTSERGDGSQFTYATMTPERYGFPTPPVDPRDSIRERMEKAKAYLDELLQRPEPGPDEFVEHPPEKEGEEPIRINRLALHRSSVENAHKRYDSALKIHEMAQDAYK